MKSEKKYKNECYIDGENRLIGILDYGFKCQIDFDIGVIICDNNVLALSDRQFSILSLLILNYPEKVSHDEIYAATYSEKEIEEKGGNLSTLQNNITELNKYLDNGIKSVKNTENLRNKDGFIIEGFYKIELKKTVKKLSEIKDSSERRKIVERSEYKRDIVRQEREKSSLEVSYKFLNSGACRLAGNKKIELSSEDLLKLSGIYNDIYSFTSKGKNFQVDNELGLLENIYDAIIFSCESSKKYLLKLEGPLGSYKNRIMQYLYLTVLKNEKNIYPVYINLSTYEVKGELQNYEDENELLAEFENDLTKIDLLVKANSKKNPLVFVDGIRDFSCGKEPLYYELKSKLEELDCKVVVCVDCDFTFNEQQKFRVHPLAGKGYQHSVKIKSMDLNKSEESIRFIDRCIELSSIELEENETPETIYNNLLRLDFSKIDAYWLTEMLKTTQTHSLLNDKTASIADVCHGICINYLKGASSIDHASELAYKFEYDSAKFDDAVIYFDAGWRLIRKGRIYLEYLIARRYIKLLSEIDLVDRNEPELIKSFKFFNMVMQKSVNRFVLPLLKGNDICERQIMHIARYHYDKLTLFGKSELIYLMARLKSFDRMEQSLAIIKNLKDRELNKYLSKHFDSTKERRDTAFLLSGMFSSLIKVNDEQALSEYIKLILSDGVINEVNRGFHLEYYNDRPYNPQSSLLNYKEDLTVGERTLSTLCIQLERKMLNKDNSSLASVLELLTICSLIQARIEEPIGVCVFDITQYISKCIKYIDWVTGFKILGKIEDIGMYFTWFKNELRKWESNNKTNISYNLASPFNKMNKVDSIERAGWLVMKIEKPENIVEHMYKCWLLGMIYLPKEDKDNEYDKNKVLNMLLLHDLGDIDTGDINRPDKLQNIKFYDSRENLAMQSLFFTGTYPNAVDLSEYREAWKNWNNKKGINYLVAKDINDLQTIYQFCDYYLLTPEVYSEKTIRYWLGNLKTLETDIVKSIAKILITDNPIFEGFKDYFD